MMKKRIILVAVIICLLELPRSEAMSDNAGELLEFISFSQPPECSYNILNKWRYSK